MAFGVFDGFHEGHKHFLNNAGAQCEQLVIVVTEDSMVRHMKKISPKYSYAERVQTIAAHNPTWTIVPSDTLMGTWQVIKDHEPDIVFLGHDQQAMAEALKVIHMPYEFLEAHEPGTYKSSLLLQRE